MQEKWKAVEMESHRIYNIRKDIGVPTKRRGNVDAGYRRRQTKTK